MQKNNETQIRIFTSGYCTADRKHVFPKDPKGTVHFHASWMLLEHSDLGKIVFDTGYSDHFYSATRSFPDNLYRKVTPVFHKSEESCISVLNKQGIKAGDLDHIFISHLHADHIAGLHDLPHGSIWCAEEIKNTLSGKNLVPGVLSGILKGLIPKNLTMRLMCPEKEFDETKLFGFKAWKWAQGLFIIDLPGHAKGQRGLYIESSNLGSVLLCADAAWTMRSIRENIYPSKIVKIFVDNYKVLKATLDKLHILHKKQPDLLILPTHCPETLKYVKGLDL